ncbi:MAG: DegT/DnrJ/EryC1/StrS family aminotransferase [Nitrospiraceae bacterium]
MPALSAAMLLPRLNAVERCFPFDHSGVTYHYFARNGIYDLARLWNLDGKEVLFPAYFHGVELDALLAAGVRPSFFPVDGRMRVDSKEIVARIGPDTRAVYLIHYLGFPGPVREIVEICRERKLLLIEDCALALLSRLDDQPLGTFGDAAAFCFYKTLPVPNGGALVLLKGKASNVPKVAPSLQTSLSYMSASLVTQFESHGHRLAASFLRTATSVARTLMTRTTTERVDVGSQDFDLTDANLAMSSVVHLLLRNQRYSEIVERRRRNFTLLLDRLRKFTRPVFDRLPDGVCPLFYPLQVRDKQPILEFLSSRGIEAVNFWSRSHRILPEGLFPEVDHLRRSIVELPCHQDVSSDTMSRIADEIYDGRHLL